MNIKFLICRPKIRLTEEGEKALVRDLVIKSERKFLSFLNRKRWVRLGKVRKEFKKLYPTARVKDIVTIMSENGYVELKNWRN